MKEAMAIHTYLLCPTPEAWVQAALARQTELLIDHAHYSEFRFHSGIPH